MNEPEIFILADRTLNGVVTQIKDGQWAMEMPPSFATGQVDHVPTLREIVNYHAYDDAWVPDMLAGKTMQEVGVDNYKGDLLGDDPKGSFSAIVETACAAAEGSLTWTGSSIARGATIPPGNTSGRPTSSGLCGPTTSPW